MNLNPMATKYLIQARITADGIVEKPDVVGAIFGQTEGLLGDELDLRDLQKSGRIGRIEVEISSEKGRSKGEIQIPSSLDLVETSILASSLETIDRVGPCKAKIDIESIEDVRISKRKKIVEKAKKLLVKTLEESKTTSLDLMESVRQAVQMEEIITYGEDKCPAGPNVGQSDAIIVVEGRADILNLLRCGIKNAIAAEGTDIPKTIQDLSKERVVTAFVDGDRGGELILRELLQVGEIDFITRAPRGREVEELTPKQVMKALRHKVPAEQFVEMYRMGGETDERVREKSLYKTKAQSEVKKIAIPKKPLERETRTKKEIKTLSPQLELYSEMMSKLASTSRASLLDQNDNVVKEVKVRDLADTLKGGVKGTRTIVFDGITTQRLLDIASHTGIQTIVSTKMGNITKQPTTITIWTKDNLE